MVIQWVLADATTFWAQVTSIDAWAQPAGYLAGLVVVVKWFMRFIDGRIAAQDQLMKEGHDAMRQVSVVLQELTDRQRNVEHAIRNSPCGLRLESGAQVERKG